MADKISHHEKTKIHITAASIYGQWKSGNTMDKDVEVINKNNISFWTNVRQWLLSVILTLCSLNLAFRGHRETSYDGVCEGGNFLAIVSLMAQYDDVLGEVSHPIQEELIALVGKAVKHSLVSKPNEAPFWSVILDTTSDFTRVDQLSVVVRWVKVTDNSVEPTESFLGFVEVTSPDAQRLVDTTKRFLQELGIDILKLRGQGYDGASVMSGAYAGVQRPIKDMCPSSPVPFFHCVSHNLNLVINDAVKSIPQNEKFFTILQDVFNFFGSSLNRWRELQIESEKDSLTLKKLCTTRWSSRINAVRAVRDRYTHILKVLTRISLTSDKTSERNTASTLRKDLDWLEFVMFIVLWERILKAFSSSSKELQFPKMDLSAACRLLNCTKNEL